MFVALAALALGPGTVAADSGPAADRAGQEMQPPKATQDYRRQLRLNRLALWKAQREAMQRIQELRRQRAQREAEAAARDADPPR
jgi:hypothetical protein